jgi:hypothetical protein
MTIAKIKTTTSLRAIRCYDSKSGSLICLVHSRSFWQWTNTESNRSCFRAEYYQLEEMEDRDTCTTELFLRADGVIEFGDTDGPKYLAAAGTWSVPAGTNDYNSKCFRM